MREDGLDRLPSPNGGDSDEESEKKAILPAPPVWTVVFQKAGKTLMYLGGISFVAVACLWVAINAGLIADFNYLIYAIPTAGAYFTGRILSYVGKIFARYEDEDEIVYR